MFRIFADDKQSALALDDLALRTALANGGAYFHDYDLLTYGVPAKVLIILVLCSYVQFGCLLRSRDSQDEGFSFGNGHRVLLVSRQRPIG